MTFDPNPSLEVQQALILEQIEAMRQAYYQIGLHILMAEAHSWPTTESEKEAATLIAKMRIKQKNAARAAERLQGELDMFVAQLDVATG